ncbi:hypothetical protein ACF1GW_38510 [Streptomyces achromogenes]|uniref:hypothetical protein n=1 Tax=Streptomyces achromogenes TaxID=67255 RepID=UPI0036FF6D5E
MPHPEGKLRAGNTLAGPDEQVLPTTHLTADRPVLRFCRESAAEAVCPIRHPRGAMSSPPWREGVRPDGLEACRKVAETFIANEGISSARIRAGEGAQPGKRTDSAHGSFPDAAVLALRYEDPRTGPEGELWNVVEFPQLGGWDRTADAVAYCPPGTDAGDGERGERLGPRRRD